MSLDGAKIIQIILNDELLISACDKLVRKIVIKFCQT